MNCGAEMDMKGVCPVCDWRPGWLPIAQATSGDGRPVTTFAAEMRHKFLAAYAFIACLAGVILVITGIAGNGSPGVAGILLGPLMFWAGAAALKITRGGKVWTGLSGGEKAGAMPGLVVGGFFGLMIIPALIMCIAVLKLADLRDF